MQLTGLNVRLMTLQSLMEFKSISVLRALSALDNEGRVRQDVAVVRKAAPAHNGVGWSLPAMAGGLRF